MEEELVELKLWSQDTHHIIKLDAPPELSLREITEQLKEAIGDYKFDLRYFDGGNELALNTLVSSLLRDERDRQHELRVEQVGGDRVRATKTDKKCCRLF